MSLGDLKIRMIPEFGKFLTGIAKVQHKLRDLNERLMEIGRSARNMSVAFGAATAGMLASAGKFERTMTGAALAATKSRDQFVATFSQMSNAAMEFAGQTEFTKGEVAEGMKFMAMAGNDLNAILATMGTTMQIATAAGMDLGRAADVSTNIMAGFGITSEKVGDELTKLGRKATSMEISKEMNKQLRETGNVLAATFTNANVSMEELGRSFKKAAGSASNANVSQRELAASLGILGNAGIKAEEAGTGLRRVLTQIAGATGRSRRAMSSLGVEARDLAKPGGFPSIIQQLEHSKNVFKENGREVEFTERLYAAFGQRAGRIIEQLVGQGSESLARLLGKVKALSKEDVLKFIEEEQLKTLTGQVKKMWGQIDNLVGTLGEELLPITKKVTRIVGDLADKLRTNLSPSARKAIALGIAMATVFSGIAAAIAIAAGMIAKIVIAVAVLKVAWAGMGIAMLPFLAKIVAVIALLGLMLLFIGLIADNWKSLMERLQEWTGGADASLKTLLRSIFVFIYLGLQGEMNALTKLLIGFLSFPGFVVAALSDVGTKISVFLVQGLRDALKEAIKLVKSFVKEMPRVATLMGLPSVSEINKAFKAWDKGLKRIEKRQQAKLDVGGTVGKYLDNVNRMLDLFTDKTTPEEMLRAWTKLPGELKSLMEDVAASEFGHTVRGMVLSGVDGLKKIFGFMFEKMGDKFNDLLKDLNITPEDIKKLGRKPKLDLQDEKAAKAMERANERWADMMEGLRDDIMVLRSPFQDIAKWSVGMKTSLRDMKRLWDETTQDILGDTPADAEELIKEKGVIELANLLNVGRSIEKIGPAFDYAAKMGAEFGIEVEKIVEELFNIRADEVKPAKLPDIGQVISDEIFSTLRVWARKQSKTTQKEFAKNQSVVKMLTDLAGNSLGGIFSGNGPALTGVAQAIGGGIGAAIGGSAGPIGAAVGQALGTVIEGSGKFVKDALIKVGEIIEGAFSTIGEAIPEQRIGGAIGRIGKVFGGFMKALADVAPILIVVGAVIGGLLLTSLIGFAVVASVVTPILIVFGGAVATVAGITFVLGSALASLIGLVLLLQAPILLLVGVLAAAAFILSGLWVPLIPAFILVGIALAILVVNIVATVAVIGYLVWALIGVVSDFFLLAGAVAGVVAVFALLAGLSTETESFKLFVEVLKRSVDRVVGALEPFWHNIRFLGGAFDFLMDILIVFANAFANNAALGTVLFQFVKMLIIAVATFAVAVGAMQNAMISAWQAFLDTGLGETFANIFVGLAEILMAGGRLLLGAFELIPEQLRGDEINEALAAAADTLEAEDLASNMQDLRDAVLNSGNALENMRVEMGPLNELLNQARNLTQDELEARFDNLAAMEDTTKEMNENLINVPEGFKVALERFRAIAAGQGSLVGADRAINTGDSVSAGDPIGAGGGGNTFIFEDGAFEVTTLEGLMNILRGLIQEAAENQQGNPFAQGGNR